MPPNKLILTQQTSVSEVAQFFKVQNSKKQVRARDLGDGRIKLYVREDSFKQFFTDKLRFGFLVERDYLKAQNHVLNIIKKSDPAGENSSAFAGIKKGLDAHRQNFYSGEFSNHLDNALRPHEELSLAKEILKLDRLTVNSQIDIRQALNSQEVLQVVNAINDPVDKEIFERNFSAFSAIMNLSGPGNRGLLTIIDYHCAIDFCRVWLKEIKNIEGSKLNGETTQKLTAFAEDVVRKGVPERIDLNGGKFIDSDADLIIFDESEILAPISNYHDPNAERDAVAFGGNKNAITITQYPEEHVSTQKASTASIGATYLTTDLQINQDFMNLLYRQIESAFKNKMLQNPNSSPKLTTEGSRADPTYTIHLPVLNPFVGQRLTGIERAMIQTSFAEATKKWVDQYTNLRIKVNLAGNMNVSSIEALYREIDKAQRTN